MTSCLYAGRVWHKRLAPREHSFRYWLYWLLVNLDEMEEVCRQVTVLSQNRWGLVSLYRKDHLGDPRLSLSDAVRDWIADQSPATCLDVSGPILLLTQPRSLGTYFSPLNLYFCHDDHGDPSAVVAEVSNTPWNQRHHYLLWDGNRCEPPPESEAGQPHLRAYRHPKTFHVSPFMPMDLHYHWSISWPKDQATIELHCEQAGACLFSAGMRLRRRPLTSLRLTRYLCVAPMSAAYVLGAIYFQAFRLWIKRCPYFPHPGRSPEAA